MGSLDDSISGQNDRPSLRPSVESRVERWRGGLGEAYLLPALSSAGASLAAP